MCNFWCVSQHQVFQFNKMLTTLWHVFASIRLHDVSMKMRDVPMTASSSNQTETSKPWMTWKQGEQHWHLHDMLTLPADGACICIYIVGQQPYGQGIANKLARCSCIRRHCMYNMYTTVCRVGWLVPMRICGVRRMSIMTLETSWRDCVMILMRCSSSTVHCRLKRTLEDNRKRWRWGWWWWQCGGGVEWSESNAF